MLLVLPNADQEGDLVYRDGTLLEGSPIQTAAYLSLFTDAPARESDPAPEGSERRGYWADAFAQDESPWGSRLWLVSFMTVQEALAFAPGAAEEALAWMVREGLASSVSATAERHEDHMRLTVTIQRPGEIAPSLLGVWDLETS